MQIKQLLITLQIEVGRVQPSKRQRLWIHLCWRLNGENRGECAEKKITRTREKELRARLDPLGCRTDELRGGTVIGGAWNTAAPRHAADHISA